MPGIRGGRISRDQPTGGRPFRKPERRSHLLILNEGHAATVSVRTEREPTQSRFVTPAPGNDPTLSHSALHPRKIAHQTTDPPLGATCGSSTAENTTPQRCITRSVSSNQSYPQASWRCSYRSRPLTGIHSTSTQRKTSVVIQAVTTWDRCSTSPHRFGRTVYLTPGRLVSGSGDGDFFAARAGAWVTHRRVRCGRRSAWRDRPSAARTSCHRSRIRCRHRCR